MKSILFPWLLLGLLLLSGVTHAEGGCPPGQIPYSGTDISSCGPIPEGYNGNQQRQPVQPPPPQWATRWGAIATDSVKGSLGKAIGMASREGAEREAMADCQAKGGSACKINVSYGNECAVMMVGNTGYNFSADASVDKATQSAMQKCNAADTNCHVYYSACSLPQRIR